MKKQLFIYSFLMIPFFAFAKKSKESNIFIGIQGGATIPMYYDEIGFSYSVGVHALLLKYIPSKNIVVYALPSLDYIPNYKTVYSSSIDVFKTKTRMDYFRFSLPFYTSYRGLDAGIGPFYSILPHSKSTTYYMDNTSKRTDVNNGIHLGQAADYGFLLSIGFRASNQLNCYFEYYHGLDKPIKSRTIAFTTKISFG